MPFQPLCIVLVETPFFQILSVFGQKFDTLWMQVVLPTRYWKISDASLLPWRHCHQRSSEVSILSERTRPLEEGLLLRLPITFYMYYYIVVKLVLDPTEASWIVLGSNMYFWTTRTEIQTCWNAPTLGVSFFKWGRSTIFFSQGWALQ